MKQQRLDEAQIIGILKQQESGVTVAQICPEQAISAGKRQAQKATGIVDRRQCRSEGCVVKKMVKPASRKNGLPR